MNANARASITERGTNMRDLTLESLPADERKRAETYAQHFAESFVYYEPAMDMFAAIEDARDLVSQVWIKMGPQQ